MERRPPEGNAKAHFLLLALFIGMAGCSFLPDLHAPDTSTASNTNWTQAASCGVLVVRNPLISVKGHLTAHPSEHAAVRLWLAPDSSLTAVIRILEQCPALRETTVNSTGVFDLGDLPPGQYAVALNAEVFGSNQGFPIVEETRLNLSRVTMLWHGGTIAWSVAVFRVNDDVPGENVS